MRRRDSTGFTLVEVLVVIAIIGVLLAFVLPSLASARRSAETLKASAAARSLMQAYVLYANDHRDFVLPAHLTAVQAASGVQDDFGNDIFPPVSQRWVYRLGPYFEYGWAGTTHVGARAALLQEQDAILKRPNGLFQWAYEVSVFPSFGINRRYVGGDYRRQDWIDQNLHVRKLADAFQPSGLFVFASARFYVGPTQIDGYIEVNPPPLGAVYDENQQTASPSTAFGNVHPRYQNTAVVGWLDGRAGTLDLDGILDRRNWADAARLSGDPGWGP